MPWSQEVTDGDYICYLRINMTFFQLRTFLVKWEGLLSDKVLIATRFTCILQVSIVYWKAVNALRFNLDL